jgi:integrase
MTPTEFVNKNMVPTYTVIARHSANCPHRTKGISFVNCDCRKSIRVYDSRIADPKRRQTHFLDPDGNAYPAIEGTHKGRSPFSAKTRDLAVAEKIAQTYRDLHDPRLRALAEKELENKELKQALRGTANVATVEEAVARFIIFKKDNPERRASQRSGKTSDSSMKRYRILLGNVDPETFKVIRPGHLFTWLNKQNPRPLLISDLTPAIVDVFRAAWEFGSDTTTAKAFTDLKYFFEYCKNRGRWIKENPLENLATPTVAAGNRTTIFSDAQYNSIISAIESYYPTDLDPTKQNLEEKKQYADARRLLALVELMRWGGLAVIDALKFRLSTMNNNGHVAYRRQKTNNLAEPTLPPDVVTLLREVVPIDGDPDQPFYDKNIKPGSNTANWYNRFQKMFADAGIKSVKTDLRVRKPHAHMFRDTFVVGQIRTQKQLGIVDYDSIAKAIGDSVQTLRKHYAPWVQELEDIHRETQQRIVEAQEQDRAKARARSTSTKDNLLNIAEGRK